MGPNVLWLTESLTERMSIEPGMRVLDLGCGKAFSSIFVAKEFGALVWAADLWIAPTPNFERIRAAGVAERVFPVRAEAHELPFAEGYFDAIVSMDAYHYFGTDNLYLSYLSKFLRPGGQIGIVVPGLREELDGGVPSHLEPYWDPDFWSFHSPAWWQRHWERSGALTICEGRLPGGWGRILAGLADASRRRRVARGERGGHASSGWGPVPRLHACGGHPRLSLRFDQHEPRYAIEVAPVSREQREPVAECDSRDHRVGHIKPDPRRAELLVDFSSTVGGRSSKSRVGVSASN